MDISFHPLADLFPLLEGAEFDELVADVRANGLLEQIVLYEGKILDGRNRYRACTAAGVEPRLTPYKGDDPLGFVISLNLKRRHLTSEQKRDIIARLLKATPEKSDRQIAEVVKASPTTVGKVRAEIEPTVQSGQLPPMRVGKDGKSRKSPAKKEPKQTKNDKWLSPRTNPISAAWAKATEKQRREFALAHRTDLLRAQQADGLAGPKADHVEQERIKQAADRAEARADGLDIPLELRRPAP